MREFLKQPWLPFVALALVAQQFNMLTYKQGGALAPAYLFLIYSFIVQSAANFAFVLFFKSRGFPIVLQGKMRQWVGVVTLLYICNEMLFVTVYRMGAPYALMITVFMLTAIVILTSVGLLYLKEKISARQGAGIVLTMVAIVLIRLG